MVLELKLHSTDSAPTLLEYTISVVSYCKMNNKDTWRDCTEECRSQQHGDSLGAALILREPSDKELASSLPLLCGNLASLVDSSGRTLLHMAASMGRRGFVQWLIKKYDVNLNTQDRESGYTPLHRSIFYGQLNVAVVLMQLGADISICDNNYLSPIELAMMDRLPDIKYSKSVPCELYVWGTNTNFNLGTDNMHGRMQPEVLDYFRKLNRMISIVQVHMEKFHTVMLSACGRVWTCGHGQGGRLGLRSERTVLAPLPVPLGSVSKSPLQNPESMPGQAEVCVAAAVGRDHTLLLMESYTVLVFGLNTHHVLGISPPPTHALEPQRLSMNFLESLKSPPLGVCAGRFHSVIWSNREILTFGLNAGQLGHAKSLEKTIIQPKPVNAMFYKDVEITHVAASDGATIVATGKRHIWVLHGFQKTKLPMRYSIEIEQVAVVGGHLDSDLDPSNLTEKGEPLKVAAISKEGSVYLWQEKDLLMTRCILSPSRQLKIVNIHLNMGRSALLMVTDDGEAFSGEIKPCKKKASDLKSLKGRRNPLSPPNTDVECHVQYKQQSERNHIKEFLDPDICYPVILKRLPHAHRAVNIASDPKGRNFALVQTHPSVYLSNVPELPPEKQGLREDLLNLLSESNEWDMLHDVVFKVEHKQFPVHQYIVSRHSDVLLKMIEDAKAKVNKDSVPVITISDVSPEIFEQMLCYMYTGDCSLTHPKITPQKMKDDKKSAMCTGMSQRKRGNSTSVLENDNDVSNPLSQARIAGKKLGLTKFVSLLNHVTFEDGDIVWADPKKNNVSKVELLTVDWREPSDIFDTRILSNNGSKFSVHKCMLAARSEYFHNMLAGGWIESRGTRDLQLPLDQSVLSVLFDYIYTDVTPSLDKVGAVDFELAMQCLIAADLLLINPFKMRCEAALASLLSLRNVKVVLELSTTYNAPDLRDCCYQFACLNLPALLETGSLCGLPPPELDGLRDFYCKMHPRMECRVMTPFCDAPPIDFIKELAAGNPIVWDEDLDALDEEKMQRKAKLPSSSKKKSRVRNTNENYGSHNRTDSISSINSDDMDTSLDPEPLDWSDIVEKEESDINKAMEKVSLNQDKQKSEKHNEWIKVLNSSKVHKTVQARLKAAATVQEEMMELASSPKPDAPATTLLLQPLSPPSPSLSLSTPKQALKNIPPRSVAPEAIGRDFPQLGCSDIARGSTRVVVVPMQSVNEKRLSKLSQKQRKRLAAEDGTLSPSPIPVAVRGWEQREEASLNTPPNLSLADIMHEQMRKSKQVSPTKPISIRRSPAGSSPHAPHGSGSPWGRVENAMSPSTPPLAPSLPTFDPSPDKSDICVRFSDIMAEDFTAKQNWTRLRTKSLNLTQIEDKAIEDLTTFYNANESSEERITVRRVLSDRVALPVWITSKHCL